MGLFKYLNTAFASKTIYPPSNKPWGKGTSFYKWRNYITQLHLTNFFEECRIAISDFRFNFLPKLILYR